MFSYLTILGWYLHGLLQKILLWIPVVAPLQEDLYPPVWWYRFRSWHDWRDNLDSDRRPNDTFVNYYIDVAWRILISKINDEAESFANGVQTYILGLLGSIGDGFATFSGWIGSLKEYMGRHLPMWASDLTRGLTTLFQWLPFSIRHNIRTWADIWDWIIDQAISWAKSAYDRTKELFRLVWEWYQSKRVAIDLWWDNWQAWLAQLASDPVGTITALLGATWLWISSYFGDPFGWTRRYLDPEWPTLARFAQDCLVYWYNLWATSASLLSDFLADPLGFIGDRLEQILIDRW